MNTKLRLKLVVLSLLVAITIFACAPAQLEQPHDPDAVTAGSTETIATITAQAGTPHAVEVVETPQNIFVTPEPGTPALQVHEPATVYNAFQQIQLIDTGGNNAMILNITNPVSFTVDMNFDGAQGVLLYETKIIRSDNSQTALVYGYGSVFEVTNGSVFYVQSIDGKVIGAFVLLHNGPVRVDPVNGFVPHVMIIIDDDHHAIVTMDRSRAPDNIMLYVIGQEEPMRFEDVWVKDVGLDGVQTP